MFPLGISAYSPRMAARTQIICTMRLPPALLARAGQLVSAVGRRAIAMGIEDGAFELWNWPYKWIHDLKLSFRVA